MAEIIDNSKDETQGCGCRLLLLLKCKRSASVRRRAKEGRRDICLCACAMTDRLIMFPLFIVETRARGRSSIRRRRPELVYLST